MMQLINSSVKNIKTFAACPTTSALSYTESNIREKSAKRNKTCDMLGNSELRKTKYMKWLKDRNFNVI